MWDIYVCVCVCIERVRETERKTERSPLTVERKEVGGRERKRNIDVGEKQ